MRKINLLKVEKMLDNLEEYICVTLLSLIFILMLIGILSRYIFGFSIAGIDELCLYALVWLIFLGASYVKKVGESHINMEIFYDYICRKYPRIKKILYFFKGILIIVFLIYLVYQGIIFSMNSLIFTSWALNIPNFYLYISVSVGLSLYSLHLIKEYNQFLHVYDKKN